LAKEDDKQSYTSPKREVLNAEDINKMVNNKQPQSLFRFVTRGT
jgi:DNA polymerase III delta subunit